MMTETCPLMLYPFYWIDATPRAASEGGGVRRGVANVFGTHLGRALHSNTKVCYLATGCLDNR
jgi:hypothetical protein